MGILDQVVGSNPSAVQSATKELLNLSQKSGFSLCLLQLISGNISGLNDNIRLAASIQFKNLVMHHWEVDKTGEEGEEKKVEITENDKSIIRQHLIHLMLHNNKQIQRQLSQSLALICQSDFPEKWPNLLPEMMNQLKSSNDQNILTGILASLHSIFHR